MDRHAATRRLKHPAAGLGEDAQDAPHILRHTFVTTMLDACARAASAALGRAATFRSYPPLGATTTVSAATVMTMTTYSGPATLILADGARVVGMASLGTNQRGDLKGWSGTFRPDQASNDTRAASGELQLELPYEQIGAVAVTGVRKVLATQVLMSLVGRGPAPF